MKKVIRFTAILVFAAVLCCTADAACSDDPAVTAEESSLFKEGKSGSSNLKMVSGIPVVTLEGTHEEIGRDYGVLLKEPIRMLWNGYIKVSASLSGGTARLSRESMRMDPHIPERFRKEMRALAEAIDEEYANIVACNAFPDIYRKGGCTTFAVSGPASADGKPLLARNLDFPGLGVLKKTNLVALFKPAGYKPFVSVSWPGISGVLSGMNGDGLCCAVMEVRTGPVTTDGMPSTLLFRRVMEEAASVDEALAIVAKSKKTAPNNLMILDREGNAAVAEIGPGIFQVRTMEKGILFATNHHRKGIEKPLRCRRYAYLEKIRLNRSGPVDVKGLQAILKAVDKNLLTQQSMIFDPSSLSIRLAVGKTPSTRCEYRLLDFAKELGK